MARLALDHIVVIRRKAEAWRSWRYRRATLARLLAREGMMSPVANAYTAVREQVISNKPLVW
jgi:hypothetical protein